MFDPHDRNNENNDLRFKNFQQVIIYLYIP